MKIFAVSSLFILISQFIYGGGGTRSGSSGTFLFFAPQGHIQTNLSAYGNSGILNSVANIGSINPAAISNFNKITAGISWQFESQIDDAYFNETKYSRMGMVIPQSAGFIIPFNDFHLGLSFTQIYNSKLNFGPVLITSETNPDGNGEYYEPEFQLKVYNFSLATSYLLSELSSNSKLFIGFRLGANLLYDNEKINRIKGEINANSMNLSFGILYVLNQNENSQIGLSFTTETNFEDKMKIENLIVNNRTDSIRGTQYYYNNNYTVKGQLPSSIKLDSNFPLSGKIRLLNNISYKFYDDNFLNIKDQIEFSGSFIFEFDEELIPSLGFLYTDQQFIGLPDDFLSDFMAIYLTGGVFYKIDSVSINLAIADSHLFSEKCRKQTILKSEISLSF